MTAHDPYLPPAAPLVTTAPASALRIGLRVGTAYALPWLAAVLAICAMFYLDGRPRDAALFALQLQLPVLVIAMGLWEARRTAPPGVLRRLLSALLQGALLTLMVIGTFAVQFWLLEHRWQRFTVRDIVPTLAMLAIAWTWMLLLGLSVRRRLRPPSLPEHSDAAC